MKCIGKLCEYYNDGIVCGLDGIKADDCNVHNKMREAYNEYARLSILNDNIKRLQED